MDEAVDLKKSKYLPDFDNVYFLKEVGQYLQSKGIKTLNDLEDLFEPNYYVLIPIEILERTDISPNSKIVYGEISALSRRSFRCFATNRHLSERLGVAERTVTRSISELAEKQLIRIDIKKTKKGTYRNIFLTWNATRQNGYPHSPLCPPPIDTLSTQKRNNILEITKRDIAAQSAAWVDLNHAIQKLEENPRRDLNIIALYFSERKPDIRSKEQYQVAVKRHLRAAKQLSPFSDDQILRAVREVRQKIPGWTIETLVKTLTK